MSKDLFPFLTRYFKGHPFLTRMIRFCLWSIMALGIVSVIVFVIVYLTVPTRGELKYIQNYTSSRVYSNDGVLLGKYFIQDRTNVEYKDIPASVKDALIATEDIRFYHHHGVDTRSVFRVLIKSILLQDDGSGGGSTISQQLAKNLYERRKYWLFSLPINKIREMVIAYKIESIMSKDEILTFYLNTVPFGENAYGIATASNRYFNKATKKLKPEESAVLIGMLKGPSLYNPKRNPERSKKRRDVVLSQMVKYKFLTSYFADSLKNVPLKLNYNFKTHNDGIATYFREYLRKEAQEFLKKYPKEDGSIYNIYTDGLVIETTLDSRMQKYAEQAVMQHMKALQADFYKHWGKKKPWEGNKSIVENAVQRSDRFKALKARDASYDEILKEFNTPVKMKFFSYNGTKVKKMTPLDSIKYYLGFLHPGFIVVVPGSGEVKAWVGGIDHRYFKYDHVNINTKRQVGSTFKPIVYAAALEKGSYPCDYITNVQVTYKEYDNWSPKNSDNIYGGEYSMQGALTNSINTVSAQLIMKAGIDKVMTLAQQMGIESPLDAVPSLALGTADVSLYEMVGAYSVFPNRGNYVAPSFISKITDCNGKVIYDLRKERKSKRVISEETADMMVKMLQNVVDHGTASRLRLKFGITGDVAGKTGTTQNHADGWFIGFTPKLVAGVWVGAEDRRIHFRSIDMGQGATTALPIWGLFMNKVNSDPTLRAYTQSKFESPSTSVYSRMSCADYIPPDTTNHWWWPFDKQEEVEPEELSFTSLYKKTNNYSKKKEVKARPLVMIKDFFRGKKKRRR